MNSAHDHIPTAFCAVGIDIGGTKIAAGLVSFPEGAVRARRRMPTPQTRNGEAFLAGVVHLCEELTAEAQRLNLRLDGIGIGVCELVDLAGNVISDNCVPWQGIMVRERLSTFAPTVIEADVRAAAFAEATFGAGKPFRQFLYLTVGTGISCSLVLDGKPFAGARGATGTMASSSLTVECERCGHVSHRTLEEIASGPALVARYNQRRPGAAVSGHDVLAAAVAGDTEALDVVRFGGEALGAATGLMVSVLDPEAIIVGGGLGLSEGLYWETFITSTREHIWSEVHRGLPILRADTGDDAGLIGSAAMAWKRPAHRRCPTPFGKSPATGE